VTKAELVLDKSARIRGRLARMAAAIRAGGEAFGADQALVEQAAFNIFLAMQEAIDLASHIVADEGWGTPETLGELFDVLASHGVIVESTAEAMRRGTRLRNLIAHAYVAIQPDRLFDSVQRGMPEIERFLAEIGSWLERAAGIPA
jgi:uncharacterized protein YutE (UPF0331/DUF86 family)